MKFAAGDSSKKYDAICVKECPSGLPKLEEIVTSGVLPVDCLATSVDGTCPYPMYNATIFLGYCVPEFTSTMATL
jgi:hypothetical protein